MKNVLIHIGYHKTGTTWLQQRIFPDRTLGFVLAQPWTEIHDAFVLADPFEFDPAAARRRFKGPFDEAEQTGAVPVVSHEGLCGRELYIGMDAKLIADRLHETFDDARVLIVIREQREMILSGYRARVARAATDSIDRTWGKRADRARGGERLLRRYEYHRLIAYYRARFGADRVLVLPYELLIADAAGFVGAISRFVGLPEPAHVPTSRANVGLPAGLLALTRYANRIFRALGLRAFMPRGQENERADAIRQRVLRALANRTPAGISRRVEHRWRQQIQDIVGERFAESNRITSELVGIDLAALGYVVAREEHASERSAARPA